MRRGYPQGIIGKGLARLEEATGVALVRSDELDVMEAVVDDYKLLNHELEQIGWTQLNIAGGRQAELTFQARRRTVMNARYVWLNDPQAGAAVELMNEFCFGRGVPAPRAKDKKVQEVIDDAWNDADNQEVLTSFDAQLALGTDLSLQSNVFLLIFDDKADGKVKLSILRHDDVQDAVTHPDKRHRVLYYLARQQRQEWDYKNDRWKMPSTVNTRVTYYEHWRNVELSDEDGDQLEKPDPQRVGEGGVYHIRINRHSEMVFGAPRFQRTIRWFCHDDQTEALTADGWLGLDELERRWSAGAPSKVAAWDRATGEMHYVDGDLHVFPYEGEMVRFQSRTGYDMLVTPNHRMWLRDASLPDRGDWRIVEAGDVPVSSRHLETYAATPLASGVRVERFVLPGARRRAHRWVAVHAAAGIEPGEYEPTLDVPMEDFLRWLGWWIAEGSVGGVVCQSLRSPRLARLKAACAALCPGGEWISENRTWWWRPYAARALRAWLGENIGYGAYKKRLPEFVFSLERGQQWALLEGLMDGDGGPDDWRERGRGTFSTVSRQLADDVQRLAMNAGWRATLRVVLIRGRENYRVDVASRCLRRMPKPVREFYSGRVWCFSTSYGTMITRRNGAACPGMNTSYNDYVRDRLDIVNAAASLIMKRKIKGTPSQLARSVQQVMNRSSLLASSLIDENVQAAGPRAASTVVENDAVQHEPFNLDTRAGNALTDAQIIRAPISAAERWTQAYFGDTSSSTLATATSLELPILKAVEARQEVWEQVFRWFLGEVIARAVDTGRISKELAPEEIEPVEDQMAGQQPADFQADMVPAMQQALREAVLSEIRAGRKPEQVAMVSAQGDRRVYRQPMLISLDAEGGTHYRFVEGHEDQIADEKSTERDLSFDFSMPNPLRRMMTDLVSSITSIAQTFDPNNTNLELSRALLTIALGEALEVEDPSDLVEKIFPDGYQDSAVMAAQQQAMGQFGPSPNGDTAFPSGADSNPYGGPMNATRPEKMRSSPYQAIEAVVRARDGSPIVYRRELLEHFDDMPEPARVRASGRREQARDLFQREVIDVTLDELEHEAGLLSSPNGK